LAVDLNHDGAMDIVASKRFGAIIFWSKVHSTKASNAVGAAH
jgi:hypothetical protein